MTESVGYVRTYVSVQTAALFASSASIGDFSFPSCLAKQDMGTDFFSLRQFLQVKKKATAAFIWKL